MTKFYVDNRLVEAPADQSLLQACLTLGYDLPYFCWHPAMGSVGACRQCAIKQYKDEKDERGRIVMSCMTPVAEGTRISISDPEAASFRASIIEGLMLNHPHDCPVCDEGGECHLQDMTVMTGHDYRRYRFNKRTFYNQHLGPFVHHEMNRCIQCYRCVRYYREYAGGRDFNQYVKGNTVYFGRQQEGVLESEFAGNLVEICPTGVFTDKTLRKHYTRKWDLQMAPSICVHCGIGCNTTPGERYGSLRRIVNRYNGDVNSYFLCDRGRFGYEFVNSPKRIRQPQLRKDGKLHPVTATAALDHLRPVLMSGKVIGIGSPRASLEGNFALRAMVGPERFFAGVADTEHRLTAAMLDALKNGPARTPSLHEVELSDAVLVLGEDVTQVAPLLALALRQSIRQKPFEEVEKLKIPLWLDHAVREAVQDQHGPLFIATPHATKLDDVATEICPAAPDDLARLGFAVAHELDGQLPVVSGLSDGVSALAARIAQALKGAKRPLVVAGPSLNSEPIIKAAASIAWALCRAGKPAGLSFTAPEANSFGLGLMDARPLREAFEAVRKGEAESVVILENDLYRRAPQSEIDELLNTAKHVIVLDSLMNRTASKAEVTLPAGTFAESDGTLVSSEGRAQRFFQVFVPQGDSQASWRWLRDAMLAAGQREAAAWKHFDHIVSALAEAIPALARAADAAPSAAFRAADSKIPREPHRYSGRTAIHAGVSVSEPKPPEDAEAPFTFTMEGYPDQPPPALVPFFWSPGWNSIQSVNKFQEEIAGPLRGGNPGVRLIEPGQGSGAPLAGNIPEAFSRRPGEWLMVPLYHIFGSEELSAEAPGVAELTPKPYLVLGSEDATALTLNDGGEAQVVVNGSRLSLPVRVRPDMPVGVAGLPVGLPVGEFCALPAWGRISKQ
ncbi:MAG TPA: NADH-quinone oxidoreductase subunit NuoG [Terriglobia bacterium]|nr:NADH-quinone oxidoreductase subunit NuoG [Terriglobia bacterium]